ncbi:peptidase families S8 and S53 subfamily [Peptoniphilus indolicus ATCC 29427]|uniref:Peptidase families S8 and S53 subfamily n=2 Tax=Peptoniphilus indolicus TaxID=33030 RepID=G4D620_9FIRM|nr:peptidase families S8 and S53 subfamily [Peptoniphilus indolicus ATCC 29427]
MLAIIIICGSGTSALAATAASLIKEREITSVNENDKKQSVSEEELKEEFPLIANYLKSQTIEKRNNGIVTMIVKFDKADREKALAELKKIPNLKVKYEYNLVFDGAAIEVPEVELKKIFEIDEVDQAIESQPVEPAMTDARKVIKLVDSIKNEKINKKYKFDGRGMVIASIDSGADLEHKDLQMSDDFFNKYAKIKTVDQTGHFTNKVPHGFNYCDANFELEDNFFAPHGQHIAGILAGSASEEDAEKGLGIRGVAPGAQLLVYRIFADGQDKDGYTPTSGDDAVYHAMEDAIKHGADVISLSIGDPGVGRRGDLYDTAIRNAQEYGVAVSVSMGNYGASSSSSTFDNYTNNAFGNVDTSMTVSGAANPYAIGVAASRNTGALYPTVELNGKDYPVAPIGERFEFPETFEKFEAKEYEVYYLGRADAEIFKKFENKLDGKVVAVARDMDNNNLPYQKLDKARLYGAIGFILVNDIMNKNRDTFMEEVPTGFERISQKALKASEGMDPILTIGISGNAGKELFNLSNDNVERLKPIDEPFKIKIKTKEYKTRAAFLDETAISGFSAWGPNNQLELKPDITAPGQEIISLGNNHNGKNYYVQMSGTSMSQPVIAGVTALLYSKIQEDMQSVLIQPKNHKILRDRAVPKIPEEIGKYTRSELAKFLMMSTARPMRDKKVPVGDTFLESSPRHQGAGQVNVENAFSTNVFLSHEGRPSVSLKEIKETTKFTVDLNNFSNTDQVFNIKTGNVITDNIVSVQKQKSGGGYDDVHEIHPKVVDGASITPSVQTIKVPANSKASVSFTLKAVSDGKDKFVEGFIYFESQNNEQPSLSIPYMGFLGDWGKERIVDLPEWDSNSKSKLTTVLEASQSHDGAEGQMKKLGIDGMIPNNKTVNPDMIATNGYEVIPRIIALRDANDYKISVVNENKEVVQVLQKGNFYKKYIHAHYLERDWYKPIVSNPDYSLGWRGTVLNKNWKPGRTDFVKELPDGQYYFKLEFRSSENHDYQVDYLPIKLDRQKPEIKKENIQIDKANKTLTVTIDDNFGISYIKGSLDGKAITFERVDDQSKYKKFVAKEFNLSENSTNKLNIQATDFAKNSTGIEVSLEGSSASILDERQISNEALDKAAENIESMGREKLTNKDHSVVKSKIMAHAELDDEGREVMYPSVFAAWTAFSPDSISRNKNIEPGNLSDIENEPYRIKIQYYGMEGDVMSVTSYNPAKKGYEPLREPNLREYPKEYKFEGNGYGELYAVLYEGFNSVNLKIVDKDGKVITNRGYTFSLDAKGPELELYNVKLPEDMGGDKRAEIFFPSENYTLEGKVFDDSSEIYAKVDDVSVFSWDLFGENHREKRFKHQGHSKDGEMLTIEVGDKFGTSEKHQFVTKIDSEAPIAQIKDKNSLTPESKIEYTAEDKGGSGVWQQKLLVNGKEYKNDEIKNYEVEGEPGKYFIYLEVKDLAGNTSTDSHTINLEDTLPTLKLKKNNVHSNEVEKLESAFEIPNGIEASYIEYADKYESAKLDDEWHDRDTIKPYRLADRMVLRSSGEHELNVLVKDKFGRSQVQTFKVNITDGNETSAGDKPQPKPIDPKPQPGSLTKEELASSVTLKKTKFISEEFRGISQELNYPVGAKLELLTEKFETIIPGHKIFKVRITKDGVSVEKTFEIDIVEKPSTEKPRVDTDNSNNNFGGSFYFKPSISAARHHANAKVVDLTKNVNEKEKIK